MLDKKGNVEDLKNCNKYNIKKNKNSLTWEIISTLSLGVLISQQRVATILF